MEIGPSKAEKNKYKQKIKKLKKIKKIESKKQATSFLLSTESPTQCEHECGHHTRTAHRNANRKPHRDHKWIWLIQIEDCLKFGI